MLIIFYKSAGNRDDKGFRVEDIAALGERDCMDFLRKTDGSEVPDEVRQSPRQTDMELRSTPIRRARMYGFP